jgi:hypothetical protein
MPGAGAKQVQGHVAAEGKQHCWRAGRQAREVPSQLHSACDGAERRRARLPHAGLRHVAGAIVAEAAVLCTSLCVAIHSSRCSGCGQTQAGPGASFSGGSRAAAAAPSAYGVTAAAAAGHARLPAVPTKSALACCSARSPSPSGSPHLLPGSRLSPAKGGPRPAKTAPAAPPGTAHSPHRRQLPAASSAAAACLLGSRFRVYELRRTRTQTRQHTVGVHLALLRQVPT